MGFFDSAVSGFAQRHREYEQENMQLAAQAADREGKVFEHLLNSPDASIRAMAATGLIQGTQPQKRRSGLRGWMGEMEANPMYPQLLQYMHTPQLVVDEPAKTITAPQAGYLPTPPPATGAAAQTTTQTTAAGEPGPTPVASAPPQPQPGFDYEGQMVGAPPPQAGIGPALGKAPVSVPADQPGPGTPFSTIQANLPPGQEPAALQLPARTHMELPHAFATAEDTAIAQRRAQVAGDYEGLVDLFRRSGSPNPEQEARDLYISEKRRANGIHEGDARQLPDGRWVQDLYDNTGRIVSTIPASPHNLGAGGNVTSRDSIAFAMYGKQGEDPKLTLRRLTPQQMSRVVQEETNQAGIRAAEVGLRRAQTMANAPLSAQYQSQLIEQWDTKWNALQKPVREMQRQFNNMVIGLKRFNEGDRIGGAQDVLVTFQKMLDPISVVRESEYARTGEGLGLLQRLEGYVEKLRAGGAGVPAEDMAGMVETARQMLDGMSGWNDAERQRITDRAAQYGIDPGYIFGGGVANPPPKPLGTVPPAAGATPGAAAAPAAAAPAAAAPGASTSVKGADGKWRIVIPQPQPQQ